MLDYKSLLCFVTVFLVVNVCAVDGFTSRCDFNNTLFVQNEDNATFTVNITANVVRRVTFYRRMPSYKTLLYAYLPPLRIYSKDDRVNLTITNESALIITLYNVTIDDYGIYELRLLPRHCWELFVLDIWNPQNITKFEEFLPAYFDATPRASSMVRPRVNATATWLLDGLNFSRTANFIEQDARMIIMRMPRHLNAKNVTYRITEDNGSVHDVNLTLWVLYGPYSPLQFSPSGTSYIVTRGDVLPDITCSTDCNPSCEITWDRSGKGNVLSLGKVDKSSKGMYTCRATRNGTERVVERNLYVEVNEWSISLLPEIAAYFLSSGDTLADIICKAECSPSCDVDWGRHSSSNILSLGQITSDMSGEYVCTATQNFTGRTVNRSVVIHVKDETSFIAAVAILGTMQGVTLIFIFVFTLYWLRTSDRNCSCLKGIARKTIVKMENRTKIQHEHETDISTVEMEHYEGLDSLTNFDTQEIYENIT